MSRRTWFGMAILAGLAACAANAAERRGDALLARGDTTGAAAAYAEAMAERPIMDFDYERVRDKRTRLVGDQFDAKVAAATSAPADDPFEQLRVQLATRREARDARAPKATVAPLERAVRDTAKLRFAAEGVATALPTAQRIVDALEHARTANAPQEVFDALLAALATTVGFGLPPVTGREDVRHVATLLDLVDRMVANKVPDAIVATARGALMQLAPPAAITVAAADAQGTFDAASALRRRLAAYGAPAPAMAIVGAAQEAALAHLTGPADAEAAAHHHAAALALLEPLLAQVADDHPLRARAARLAGDAAAWHASEAAALPAGFRRLLQLQLAAMFGAPSTEASALATQLAPEVTTQLAIRASVGASGDCAGDGERFARALATGAGRDARVRVQLQCTAGVTTSAEQKTVDYWAEEQVTKEVPVQVTTKTWGQVGSHQEQCSKASSLEGYTWQGVCTVPDMGWIESTHTELKTVTELVEVTKQHPYTVEHAVATARASGTASYTWDDGTTLEVPFSVERRDESTAYEYDAPPATRTGTRQHARKTHAASFSAATTLGGATGEAASQLVAKLHAAVRAHRARLAAAEGSAATARGDQAAAGEAFVRSLLLDRPAIPADTAAWLARTHALTEAQATAALAGTAWHAPPPIAGAPVVAAADVVLGPRSDGYEDALGTLEMDVSAVTQKSYHAGIKPPNEYVIAHLGALPTTLPTATGDATTITLGMGLSYAVLGMKAPRYGITWHDEASFRLTFGIKRGARDYTNGEDEGVVAWGIEPQYKLYAGLRHHYLALFGGASIGYLRMRAGGTLAKGGHFEPAARVLLRVYGRSNVVLEGAGFVRSFGDWQRRDRLAVGIPLSRMPGGELLLTYERTPLRTTSLLDDGTTEMNLGVRDVTQIGVQFGARL